MRTNKLSKGCRIMIRMLLNHRCIITDIPETECFQKMKNLAKAEQQQAVKDWEWCIQQKLLVITPKRHVCINPERLHELVEVLHE